MHPDVTTGWRQLRTPKWSEYICNSSFCVAVRSTREARQIYKPREARPLLLLGNCQLKKRKKDGVEAKFTKTRQIADLKVFLPLLKELNTIIIDRVENRSSWVENNKKNSLGPQNKVKGVLGSVLLKLLITLKFLLCSLHLTAMHLTGMLYL